MLLSPLLPAAGTLRQTIAFRTHLFPRPQARAGSSATALALLVSPVVRARARTIAHGCAALLDAPGPATGDFASRLPPCHPSGKARISSVGVQLGLGAPRRPRECDEQLASRPIQHLLPGSFRATLANAPCTRRRHCLRGPRRTAPTARRRARRAPTAWPWRGKRQAAPRGRCGPGRPLRLPMVDVASAFAGGRVGAGPAGTSGGSTACRRRRSVRAGDNGALWQPAAYAVYSRPHPLPAQAAAGAAGRRERFPDGDPFKRAQVRGAGVRDGEDGAARAMLAGGLCLCAAAPCA